LKLKGQDEQVDFKKYKGTLEKLYSDERALSQNLGGRKAYYDPNKVNNRDELAKSFVDNLGTPQLAGKVSETLVSINGIYAEIIQYLTNMPLYRYTVVPGQIKKLRETGSEEKYLAVYEKMISVVDGISLEVILPKILQTGLIYGIIYIYVDKDQGSETIETVLLPNEYCKKGFTTNFGTDTVTFDFKFFDDIIAKLSSSSGLKIEVDDLLELFPSALIQQYKKYSKDRNLRFQELDPKFSTAISFSPNSMPPKLYANYGIIDYETVRRNEVTRSNNELEKILVHEIPHTADGNLMFEIEEALELHDSLSRALSGVKGLKLLTTFGKTELIELQEQRAKDSQIISQAFDSIFQSAGISPEIFTGNNPLSLEKSIQKDAAFVFNKLNLIINFYNLAINNLYSFNPYQARINLLPITIYDEEAKVNMYLEAATFGIGKLEAVVAVGIKQKDILDKHILEKYLDLDNILVPLQSAHTSSGKDDKKVEETEPKDDGEEPVVVDEETEEGT
jgi:hypothetical protein